jgi:hypothetical protein
MAVFDPREYPTLDVILKRHGEGARSERGSQSYAQLAEALEQWRQRAVAREWSSQMTRRKLLLDTHYAELCALEAKVAKRNHQIAGLRHRIKELEGPTIAHHGTDRVWKL